MRIKIQWPSQPPRFLWVAEADGQETVKENLGQDKQAVPETHIGEYPGPGGWIYSGLCPRSPIAESDINWVHA
jgi:hypothetical protein